MLSSAEDIFLCHGLCLTKANAQLILYRQQITAEC